MPNPVTTLTQLDEIEARANAATPGPWQTRFLLRMWTVARKYATIEKLFFGPQHDQDWADADLCAHSRTDVPNLVASYREAVRLLESAGDGHSLDCACHLAVLCNCGLAERRQFLEGVRRKE